MQMTNGDGLFGIPVYCPLKRFIWLHERPSYPGQAAEMKGMSMSKQQVFISYAAQDEFERIC